MAVLAETVSCISCHEKVRTPLEDRRCLQNHVVCYTIQRLAAAVAYSRCTFGVCFQTAGPTISSSISLFPEPFLDARNSIAVLHFFSALFEFPTRTCGAQEYGVQTQRHASPTQTKLNARSCLRGFLRSNYPRP